MMGASPPPPDAGPMGPIPSLGPAMHKGKAKGGKKGGKKGGSKGKK